MSWFEISLALPRAQLPEVERAFADLGAQAVTLTDADPDTPDANAILEPASGEMPVWDAVVASALFDDAVDRAGLVHVLHELVPALTPGQVSFAEVADRNWTRAWMDRFGPMRFGTRLRIHPSHIADVEDDADAVIVRLDPGLAFGTGTHPTTALCLEWLDSLDLAGREVIDFGCGSGVLAIASLALGARHAIGVDNDPQALAASRDNAGRNGVAERLELFSADDFIGAPADVVVANILAGPLVALATRLTGLVRPGGLIALSGILAGQREDVSCAYRDRFDEIDWVERDGWLRICGRRRV